MKRHFSMIREFHLADWFTLANAFCGTGAIFAAMPQMPSQLDECGAAISTRRAVRSSDGRDPVGWPPAGGKLPFRAVFFPIRSCNAKPCSRWRTGKNV